MNHKEHLKSSLLKTLKDYCKNTTLHGYKYLVQPNRPLTEKCIWSAILLTTFSMTCYIFYLLLNDFNNKVTITTLENTKYSISEVPFPGVAICNINRISRNQVIKMSREIYQNINVSEEELMNLIQNFGKLYDFEFENTIEIKKLQDIVDGYNLETYSNYDTLINILLQLSPACEETLVECQWMGQNIDCNKIFQTRRTNDGFCCTFNYIKTWNYSNFSSLNVKLKKDTRDVVYFTGAGVNSGLTVLVHSDPDDYYYPLISSEGFSIKLFNSHDYPDVSSGALIESYIPLKHEVFMQISSTIVKPNPDIQTIPIPKRGCIFDNEGKTAFDNYFYSYSDCLADCKLKSILALCECIPFFLPVLKYYSFSKQICTVLDIPCLSKFKEKWMNIYPPLNIEEFNFERQNSLSCPHCFPNCFSTFYGVNINQAVLVNMPISSDIKSKNLSKYSIIHLYSDSEDTVLYETNIKYYWYDIIANLGGACSLFLGFSLISVVEFVYFITVKYYYFLTK